MGLGVHGFGAWVLVSSPVMFSPHPLKPKNQQTLSKLNLNAECAGILAEKVGP